MSKQPTAGISAEQRALYETLLTTHPNVERKGAAMPYTSLNGHMFSFLTPDGVLALRLPAGEREAFLKKYKTKLCEQHGRILQEYVEVPAALLKKTQELKAYFALGLAYAGSLKPKGTPRASKNFKKKNAPTSQPHKKRTR